MLETGATDPLLRYIIQIQYVKILSFVYPSFICSFQMMRMDENSEEEEFDDEGLEGIDLEDEEDMGSRTIQVGDKNFTFSFA